MPTRVRVNQVAFTSGEMSANMAARADTSFYLSGVADGLNNIARLEGPLERRWGTRYFDALPGTVRLAAFEFSRDQTYLLVFSDSQLDVYYGEDLTLATTVSSCPWTAAMLPRLKWAVSGDTVVVCHPDLKTQLVKRTGAASFTVSDFTFEENSGSTVRYQPYYKFAAAAVTMAASATSGSVTLTASASFFTSDHVGTIIRMGGKEILITAVASGTSATGTVRSTLSSAAATTDWDEQVGSAVRGYFNCAAFFDGRLVFGGHKALQSYMFLSKANAPFNFDIGTAQANEAIWQDIGDDQVAEVLGLVAFRHLQIFTDSGFYIVPKSDVQAITPDTFTTRRQVPYASGFVGPQPFDGATLFVQDNGAMVREALWNDVQQAYDGPPVSHLANHLINAPVDLCVLDGTETRPEQYALLINGDGTGALYMSLREQKVRGWLPVSTDGTLLACAVVSRKMVIAVSRDLGGTTYTLEQFDPDLALDCAKTDSDVTAKTTWTGFDHLAGKEVNVLSGNYSLGAFTVAGDGSIELPYEVSEVEVGLYFERRITPLPPDPQLPDGQARGRTMRLVKTIVTVDNALGFEVNGRQGPVRYAGDDFNEAPTPQTGEIEFRNLGYGKRVEPTLTWPEPVRCTVLGLAMDIKVNR